MSERKCENCIHLVRIPQNEEFDICNVGGGKTEIYKDLPYRRCSGYEPVKRNHDAVNHPAHYTQGGIECIDCIKAALGENFIGFLIGNVIKYAYRYKDKNGVEDLKKAQVYLAWAVKELSENA